MDERHRRVLRVHDEPYRYLDDAEVHARLCAQPQAYLDHILKRLQQIADGRAQLELPDKLLFRDAGARSDFRVMPCVLRAPDAVRKTVKLVGTNARRRTVPDQITVGKAFLLDADENYVALGLAGCLFSSARTGACAATALRLLAPAAKRLHIVGAGRVGYYAGFYAAALGQVEYIHLSDHDPARAAAAAELLAAHYPALDISAGGPDAQTPDEVLILATDSETPILDATEALPTLTISLGADSDWQSEVADSVVGRLTLYAETSDSLHYGDLKRWKNAGLITPEQITTILPLVAAAAAAAGPALFISTGSALFDNLTIDYIAAGLD